MGGALGLVGVEQALIGPVEAGCQLPGQIGSIADTGAHALPHEGRGQVGGISCDQHPSAPPAGRHLRPKRVDGAPLKVCVLGGDPTGQQLPDPVWIRDLTVAFVRLGGDFPTPADARASAVSHRAVRVAELHRVIPQIRPRTFEEHVHNEPALVKAQIIHPATDHRAREGVGPIAANQIPGLAGSAGAILRCARQGDAIIGLRQGGHVKAGQDFGMFCLSQLAPQQAFQIGLVQAVAGIPAMGGDFLRARPVQQQRVIVIDKLHARIDPHLFQQVIGNANGLENAHHLVIEMHRTRQMIHRRLAVDHQHRHPLRSQQVGKRCPCGPIAQDCNIIDHSSPRY